MSVRVPRSDVFNRERGRKRERKIERVNGTERRKWKRGEEGRRARGTE